MKMKTSFSPFSPHPRCEKNNLFFFSILFLMGRFGRGVSRRPCLFHSRTTLSAKVSFHGRSTAKEGARVRDYGYDTETLARRGREKMMMTIGRPTVGRRALTLHSSKKHAAKNGTFRNIYLFFVNSCVFVAISRASSCPRGPCKKAGFPGRKGKKKTE